ncbi:MAG: amino acid permease [Rickettsiaceae bacterium H1]|nr:amino acid permease [Rickettsiaceae bacterium H1]
MKKIGFWPLFAIVIGGQVGSGIFMLPSNLAAFGIFGIFGLIIASVGAISLAIVFASLCAYYPKTGGPHVYVREAFGKSAAFFTGWTYWLISWVSSTAVVIAIVGYLMPMLGDYPKEFYVIFEILILLFVTLINLQGVSSAGSVEVILSVMKFTPLLIIPFVSLIYFDPENLTLSNFFEGYGSSELLSRVTLITLWGFIGLEAATTPANSVINPKRNIPLAVVFGTISVAVVYLVNSLGVMGVVPGNELQNSGAPYVEATQYVFGGNWYVIVSLIASIVCFSSLNAWVLTSGQIALGLSEDGLMPEIFAKKNSHNAPHLALIISGLGIIPLLFLTNAPSFAKQISSIIEFSVVAFLFVYVISVLSFLYIQIKKGFLYRIKTIIGIFALIFCCWVIFNTDVKVLLIASFFVFSGVPLYIFSIKNKSFNK